MSESLITWGQRQGSHHTNYWSSVKKEAQYRTPFNLPLANPDRKLSPRKKPLKSSSTSLTRCLVERTEDNLSHQLHKPGKTQNLFPPTAAKSQNWKFLGFLTSCGHWCVYWCTETLHSAQQTMSYTISATDNTEAIVRAAPENYIQSHKDLNKGIHWGLRKWIFIWLATTVCIYDKYCRQSP